MPRLFAPSSGSCGQEPIVVVPPLCRRKRRWGGAAISARQSRLTEASRLASLGCPRCRKRAGAVGVLARGASRYALFAISCIGGVPGEHKQQPRHTHRPKGKRSSLASAPNLGQAWPNLAASVPSSGRLGPNGPIWSEIRQIGPNVERDSGRCIPGQLWQWNRHRPSS